MITTSALKQILSQPDYELLAEEVAAVSEPANKFHAIRTEVDGRMFDSKREAAVYQDLRQLEQGGYISDLRCQVKYDFVVNGIACGGYVADFVYLEDGMTIVADVKSGPTKTAVYRLKKKLMLALYGIEIKEIA